MKPSEFMAINANVSFRRAQMCQGDLTTYGNLPAAVDASKFATVNAFRAEYAYAMQLIRERATA